MANAVESIATALILILVVILFLHGLNGTTGSWIKAKFVAAPA